MMDFIMVPVLVGICVYGVYSIFELFARRKERVMLIEKIGSTEFTGTARLGQIEFSNKYSSLKWAGLLLGVGLGLLIGYILGNQYVPYDEFVRTTQETYDVYRRQRDLLGIIYGSCCMLGGGLGLIGAFLLELKLSKKNRE